MAPLELLVLLLVIAAPVVAVLVLVRLLGRRVASGRQDARPVDTARVEGAEQRPGSLSAGSAENRT